MTHADAKAGVMHDCAAPAPGTAKGWRRAAGDGDIDGDDYFIIDSNLAFAQTQPDFPTGAGGSGLTSVPEAGAGWVVAAGLGVVSRRRRLVAR